MPAPGFWKALEGDFQKHATKVSRRRNHITRCSIALVVMFIGFAESYAQLPVRTRDLRLISNNNVNYTSVQAVNGQVANWSLILPSSQGSTGSLLTSSVAGTAASLSWLPPSSNGDVLQLSGGVPTWSDLSGTFWALTGNATANSWSGLTGSFLGTTTAQDLVLNTNGEFRARLVGGAANTGNLVLGYRSDAIAPFNSTAAQATARLTVLGGDISLNSENNTNIIRGIYFNGTSGSGNFRIGSDGGDIFWQGGGGYMLQMGSFWGMRFYGNQAAAGYPTFVAGSIADPTVNIIVTRTGSPGVAITASSGMTADQQQWRNSAGAVLSVVNSGGNFGIGVTTAGSSKLRINSSATSGNAIQLDPWGSSSGNTGEERFLELSANGTNYVAFKAPDAILHSTTYTLPSAIGNAGQFLRIAATPAPTSNTATLEWATVAASGSPQVEDFHVPADNTAINQGANTTYIRLDTDGPAVDRTTTIANGSTDGQVLVLRCEADDAADGVQLLDAGNMRLNGVFNMTNDDTITLIWDADDNAWIETSRQIN